MLRHRALKKLHRKKLAVVVVSLPLSCHANFTINIFIFFTNKKYNKQPVTVGNADCWRTAYKLLQVHMFVVVCTGLVAYSCCCLACWQGVKVFCMQKSVNIWHAFQKWRHGRHHFQAAKKHTHSYVYIVTQGQHKFVCTAISCVS